MPAETERQGVSIHHHDAVATILIDRPRARNALGLATWRAIPALAAAADVDPEVKAVVVRGAGGSFGAGNDIAEFGALRGDPEGAEAFGLAMATAMRALETLAKPVIMAIEGPCYGAAVALTLAGDLRVASDDAAFAVTPARLGAVYLRSDLHRLAAAVGAGQCKSLIYSARPIGAARALEIGLVDTVIAADQFETELQRIVAEICAGSSHTLRGTKTTLRGLGHGDVPLETPETLGPFVAAIQGPDFAEGVAAFLAKRVPKFL